MATQEPGQQPSLTALPRLEDLPKSADGYDAEKVREAFEAFRRHSAQLQAQLRVLQAASRSPQSVEPTGHAVRMDSLHLIRSAAEFADTVENDAQRASEAQLAKTEEEVRRRRREQQEREAEIERYRQESERQRAEMLNNVRNEVRELLANANRDATQELGDDEVKGVGEAIVKAAKESTEASRTPPPARPVAAMAAPPPPLSPAPPAPETEESAADQPAPESSGKQQGSARPSAPADESQDEQQP